MRRNGEHRKEGGFSPMPAIHRHRGPRDECRLGARRLCLQMTARNELYRLEHSESHARTNTLVSERTELF
jgi:hypothetical protein